MSALGDSTYVQPNRLNQEVCGTAKRVSNTNDKMIRSKSLTRLQEAGMSKSSIDKSAGCGGAPNDAAIVANRALRIRGRFLKLAPFNSCQGGEVFLVQNDPISCGGSGDVSEDSNARNHGDRNLSDMNQMLRSYITDVSPDANNLAAESAAPVLRSRAPHLAPASAGLSTAWQQHQLVKQWAPEAVLTAAGAYQGRRRRKNSKSSSNGTSSSSFTYLDSANSSIDAQQVFVRCQTFSGMRSGSWLAHRSAVLKAKWPDARATRTKSYFNVEAWFGKCVEKEVKLQFTRFKTRITI